MYDHTCPRFARGVRIFSISKSRPTYVRGFIISYRIMYSFLCRRLLTKNITTTVTAIIIPKVILVVKNKNLIFY